MYNIKFKFDVNTKIGFQVMPGNVLYMINVIYNIYIYIYTYIYIHIHIYLFIHLFIYLFIYLFEIKTQIFTLHCVSHETHSNVKIYEFLFQFYFK